jgi:O-antigen/teichoic acid export membrane protein
VALFFHLNSPQAVILLGLMFIVSLVTPLNQGTLQGLQRFGWFATITLLSSFLRLVLAIGFVLMGLGVNGAILGIVVGTLLACLISFQPLGKVLKGPRTPMGSLQSLWTYSILALAVTVGTVVLYSIDTVLAKHFLSARDAGLYAALATIGRTVLLISIGVTTVMFPRVVVLHERGEPHTRVVVQAMLGVLILSAAVEIVFYFVPSLMTKILFGQAFVAVAGQLAPYGMAMLLLAVSWVIISYFLALGNRSVVLIIFLACALLTGLIIWHHAAIAQFVQAMIVTNAALLLALLIAFGLRAWRTPAGSRFRPKRGRFNWRGKI